MSVTLQQATLTALNLVARYPDDDELVRRMTSLAIEEASHLRRVARLLHDRGLKLARRRPNPYVHGLLSRLRREREEELKIDRLLVSALIEARSCERFTLLLHALGESDAEVAELLTDLGPAEAVRVLESSRALSPQVQRRRDRHGQVLQRAAAFRDGLIEAVLGEADSRRVGGFLLKRGPEGYEFGKRAGISREREAEVLAAWHARASDPG